MCLFDIHVTFHNLYFYVIWLFLYKNLSFALSWSILHQNNLLCFHVFWYSSCKILICIFGCLIFILQKFFYVKLCYLIFLFCTTILCVLKDKNLQFLHIISFQLSHAKMENFCNPHSPQNKILKKYYLKFFKLKIKKIF